jgi:hypothetical protein
VAVKRLKVDANGEVASDLLSEAKLLSELKHENILKFIGTYLLSQLQIF